MKKAAVRRLSFAAAAAAVFLLAACETQPAAFGLEVEPRRIERALESFEPAEGTLTVSNPRAEPVNVRVSASGYRFLQDGLRLPSAENWLSFEPNSFTLGPEASVAVTYTVTPPASATRDTAGEYVAAVLVDELPADETGKAAAVAEALAAAARLEPLKTPDESGQARISIVPRLAFPVYLQIAERRVVRLEIERITAERRQAPFDTAAPDLLWLKTVLSNRGTVHVRPSGTVSLFDSAGAVVRAVPLGRSVPVLPSGKLTVPTVLPLPDPGLYRAVATVETGQSGDLLQRELTFRITEEGEVEEEP